MKTIAAHQGKSTGSSRFPHATPVRQRGMGATIVLFTIALIVMVGAALAYASRSNPSAINVQGAKVYSGILLKQSAEFRDAFSRYAFSGANTATMTFNAAGLPAGDLFTPSDQFGNYQTPPPQATTAPTTPSNWLYNANVPVLGIGTAAGESIVYVPDVNLATCQAVNLQMYGTTVIPVSTTVTTSNLATAGTAFDATPGGRATGCFQITGGTYVFYSTLNEA